VGGATRWTPPGYELAPLDPAAARRAHLLTAALALAVGVVLTAGAVAGRAGVVGTVALAQVALAPAWMLGTHRPGRTGGLVIGLAAAAGADVALLVRDRTSPAVLLGVLGLAIPALLAYQLTRGPVRAQVAESLAGAALLVTAEVALAMPIALGRADDGNRLVGTVVLAAGVGLAAARLTDAAAPVPRIADGVPYGVLALLAAAAGGAVGGVVTAGGPLSVTAGAGVGALVGAVAGLLAVGVGFILVALPEPPRPLVAAYLSVALPLAFAIPVGYLTVLSVAG
jgi:hypothetical protein